MIKNLVFSSKAGIGIQQKIANTALSQAYWYLSNCLGFDYIKLYLMDTMLFFSTSHMKNTRGSQVSNVSFWCYVRVSPA